jgi:hypothetical protein
MVNMPISVSTTHTAHGALTGGCNMKITTNNKPRPVIDAHELTPAEREQFDYVNWEAIKNGEDSASFFRYRGELYDLAEFERARGPELARWDVMQADSFFHGLLVRYIGDEDVVIADVTF